ncbi:MAG: AraC family transcriptional regulator, partial [Enterococcus sp.]|nr:AraC family transcriptional regulator [Enterococcus sp.]
YLFTWDKFEEIQAITYKDINNIPGLKFNEGGHFDEKMGYQRLPKELFFLDGNVHISKHKRFAPLAVHIHDFVEINYMYSGKCTQSINGQKIELTEGDFCILDRDVPHSLEILGNNDILVNILLDNETLDSLFIYQLQKSRSLISEFLLKAFTEGSKHNQFIVLHTEKNDHIHSLVQSMFCEFLDKKDNYQEIIQLQNQLLIYQLTRLLMDEIKIEEELGASSRLKEIFEYIDDNYQQLSLTDLAKTFNYNATYLSSLLKNTIGKNFQELILEKKMITAENLLRKSHLSIEAITFEVGFKSTSYFYRQFKKKYGKTPLQYRRINNNEFNTKE